MSKFIIIPLIWLGVFIVMSLAGIGVPELLLMAVLLVVGIVLMVHKPKSTQ